MYIAGTLARGAAREPRRAAEPDHLRGSAFHDARSTPSSAPARWSCSPATRDRSSSCAITSSSSSSLRTAATGCASQSPQRLARGETRRAAGGVLVLPPPCRHRGNTVSLAAHGGGVRGCMAPRGDVAPLPR